MSASLDDRFDPAIRIKKALGEAAARLEHVGSTAVRGLAAKPILDAVQDFLRNHADHAARYAALKHALVARDPQDRLAYWLCRGLAKRLSPTRSESA